VNETAIINRCGTCEHHYYDREAGAFVCCNPESGWFAAWTEDDDSCKAWYSAKITSERRTRSEKV